MCGCAPSQAVQALVGLHGVELGAPRRDRTPASLHADGGAGAPSQTAGLATAEKLPRAKAMAAGRQCHPRGLSLYLYLNSLSLLASLPPAPRPLLAILASRKHNGHRELAAKAHTGRPWRWRPARRRSAPLARSVTAAEEGGGSSSAGVRAVQMARERAGLTPRLCVADVRSHTRFGVPPRVRYVDVADPSARAYFRKLCRTHCG